MARISKSLVLLNDTIEVEMARGEPGSAGNGAVGVQYDAFGNDGVTAATGTIVLEDTINEVEWNALKINLGDDTQVDTLTTAKKGWAAANGAVKVRARMSVVGGAHGVKVWLNYLTP